MKRAVLIGLAGLLMLAAVLPVMADTTTRVLIKFSQNATPDAVASAKRLCSVITHDFTTIKALGASIKAEDMETLKAIPGVEAVEPDWMAKAHGASYWTWDMDMIDVERVRPAGAGPDGTNVYVAVLDTGLVPNYSDYFSEASISTEFAMSFHNPNGRPNAGGWRDIESHGTHVTSTLLGYNVYGQYSVQGVAPGAKVIPVKVLDNQGNGYYSAIAAGILYIADLKNSGKLGGRPAVINMSLGGPESSLVLEAAIDYAIASGVAIVCSAGNEGEAGMGWPGAYPQVISVGACGWKYEWYGMPDGSPWWRSTFVGEGAGVVSQLYVTDFSSREKPGQQLDVLAPGSWVVGPYLINGAAHPPYWAKTDISQYYFLGGTSMASPHVAGAVALMLQRNPELTQAGIEAILKGTAFTVFPGSLNVLDPNTGALTPVSWGADAVGKGLINIPAALAASGN